MADLNIAKRHCCSFVARVPFIFQRFRPAIACFLRENIYILEMLSFVQ